MRRREEVPSERPTTAAAARLGRRPASPELLTPPGRPSHLRPRLRVRATAGLLSVGPCSGGSAKVSLFNAFDGTGRQVWSMQPVYTGVASITNKTLVLLQVRGMGLGRAQGARSRPLPSEGGPLREPSTRYHLMILRPHSTPRPLCVSPPPLQVGGRSGCGSYATYPPACSGGVTVTELVPGSQAQHWYLEPWGVMYRLRAAACPGKYLAVSKGCGNPGAQLLAPGPNNTDSFTLKAVPASPGSASPSPSPKASSPSPSPSPKASSPSPKASPRPPLPRPPPPAASPLQRSPPLKRSPGWVGLCVCGGELGVGAGCRAGS